MTDFSTMTKENLEKYHRYSLEVLYSYLAKSEINILDDLLKIEHELAKREE